MSASKGFRLILRFHTPILMPVVVPRLDTLLQEAMSRLHQNWRVVHKLPLERDIGAGVYCASQLILAVTPQRPLMASTEKLVTSVFRQDLHLASNVKGKFSSVFPDGNRLSRHQGISAPFGIFYGVGDAEECAALLPFLSGIGREHARHYGSFDVERIEPTSSDGWRLRPWPKQHTNGWSLTDVSFVDDYLPLEVSKPPEAVMRPPRLVREVLNAS